MMYRIVRTCGIDGVLYKDGDTIDDSAIPEGSRPSVFGMGLVEPINEQPEAAGEAATPEPVAVESQPTPAKKGKR